MAVIHAPFRSNQTLRKHLPALPEPRPTKLLAWHAIHIARSLVFLFAQANSACHCPGLYQIVAMAYAIIRSGNKQYRVSPGETVAVEKLSGEAGDKITFAEVVLHCDGDKVTLGAPLIDGAKVSGEVVEQFKDKKVIAFKFRRRKGYHRTVGHRRQLTRVKIGSIDL
jgi:large subunit ribosomal protein L21